MKPHRAVISPSLWIVAIVLLALAVGVFAALRVDRDGGDRSGLPPRATYQIEDYKRIDPALVGYSLAAEFPVGMQQPRAVAVGPEDRIHVAGDEAIHVFASDGTLRQEIALEDEPTCIAVAPQAHTAAGTMYVGMTDHVEVVSPQGKTTATWDRPAEKSLLTSIALSEDSVFVADAGSRVVLRYNPAGELTSRIGELDEARGVRGFIIPSPFFDVAVDGDGLLWVVNPGALRLEAYSPKGNLELFWGEPGVSPEGFFGCCNPAHFALLSDGRFVTAEKGLLRVKVYSDDGQFECVVAGPEQLEAPVSTKETRFDHEHRAVDVAVDSRDRVVVLDLAGNSVSIYEPKEPAVTQDDEEPNAT